MKRNLIILGSLMALIVPSAKAAKASDAPPPLNVFNTIPNAVNTGPDNVYKLATNIINILIYVAGIASVIVIIIGGIMFVVSGGSPDRTKTAKDAILYAIIGLIISLAAFAIVNFVLGGIGG